MFEKIKNEVKLLMSNDNGGHGFDHVERVYHMAMKLAAKEQANSEIVALAALLHDVDDYKLFGEENAKNLTNARTILSSFRLKFNALCNFGRLYRDYWSGQTNRNVLFLVANIKIMSLKLFDL